MSVWAAATLDDNKLLIEKLVSQDISSDRLRAFSSLLGLRFCAAQFLLGYLKLISPFTSPNINYWQYEILSTLPSYSKPLICC